MHLDARFTVLTTTKKVPTKGFLGSKSEEKWKIVCVFKQCFPPKKLPRIHRLQVSKTWQIFSIKVESHSELKKCEVFSLEKCFFP